MALNLKVILPIKSYFAAPAEKHIKSNNVVSTELNTEESFNRNHYHPPKKKSDEEQTEEEIRAKLLKKLDSF